VSKWQMGIDLKQVFESNASLQFCIARTGDGKDTDPTFKKFFQETEAHDGVIPGSYHYFRADRDGHSQAESMSKLLSSAGYKPGLHLPPAVDFEDGASLNLPGGVYNGSGKVMPIHQVHEELLECLVSLESIWGVRPMLYTGQTFHWWMSQAEPEFAAEYAKYPLWTPSYTKNVHTSRPRLPADKAGNPFPWTTPTIWQFTGEGKVAGYDKPIDCNFFAGDGTELIAFCQGSRVAAHPVSETKPDYKSAKLSAIDTMAMELERLRGLVEAE